MDATRRKTREKRRREGAVGLNQAFWRKVERGKIAECGANHGKYCTSASKTLELIEFRVRADLSDSWTREEGLSTQLTVAGLLRQYDFKCTNLTFCCQRCFGFCVGMTLSG